MSRRRYKQNKKTGRMEGAYGGAGETAPTAATLPRPAPLLREEARPAAELEEMRERYLRLAQQRVTAENKAGFEKWVVSSIGGEDSGHFEEAVDYASTEEGAARVERLVANPALPPQTKDSLLVLQAAAALQGQQSLELQQFEAEQEASVQSGGTFIGPHVRIFPTARVGPDSYISDYAQLEAYVDVERSTVEGWATVGYHIDGGEEGCPRVRIESSTVSGHGVVRGKHSGWGGYVAPNVVHSTVRDDSVVSGESRVEGSTVEGRSRVHGSIVRGSVISGAASISDSVVEDSTISGNTEIYGESMVSDSTVSGSAKVHGTSRVEKSQLSGGCFVDAESEIVASRLGGSVWAWRSRIYGVELDEGYYEEADIRGSEDVQIARRGGDSYVRYKARSRFGWGRRWKVSHHYFDTVDDKVVHQSCEEKGSVPDGLEWGALGR